MNERDRLHNGSASLFKELWRTGVCYIVSGARSSAEKSPGLQHIKPKATTKTVALRETSYLREDCGCSGRKQLLQWRSRFGNTDETPASIVTGEAADRKLETGR